MIHDILSKKVMALLFVASLTTCAFAQITGKFGTYYDQRELLFEAMPTSENDIIFLGNSITDGGEWSELFENPNCKNRGISGDIVPGVLNRLETITKGQPAMVFLMIGTNDMNHGASNDSIARAVRTVVQRIKKESPRTRLVVQSILPTNDCYGLFTGHTKRWADVAVINGMLKTMAEEEGVAYLDLYSRFATPEGKMNTNYSNDGLHLNGEGYRLWKSIVEEEIGTLPAPGFLYNPHQAKVPMWLDLGTGLNITDSYDKGTIPFHYLGFGVNADLGMTIEWGRWHVQPKAKVVSATLTDLNGTITDIGLSAELLYRFHDGLKSRLHLWAGGTLQGLVDIKSIPSLQNASVGTSVFGNVCATGMMQYDFAFNRSKTHHWLTAFGKLNLPIYGLASRPGYNYIGNPTLNNAITEGLIGGNERFGKFFPGAGTEIGLQLNLPNSNRIGFAYAWDYLSTGKKGIHRFDQAFHSFNLYFMFKIN